MMMHRIKNEEAGSEGFHCNIFLSHICQYLR